jgi:dihydrofolate synthase/folylpolyglutamate synthase
MNEYERTLEWLYALEAAKGMDFKLERVALALHRLVDPHRRYPVLHIGGTNGKGSVAAMLDSILGMAGYRVGLYTSPHLVDLTERVRVGGQAITRDAVVALTDEIRSATSARGIDLTFFEFLTVLAFLHFARSAVDVAVIEVGLGGRLDATNVVDPLAAAITTIGLDHTEWLGPTLAAIAAEKGGIIKAGRPIVLGRIGGEAAAVLAGIAHARRAVLIARGREYRVRYAGDRLTFGGFGWEWDGLRIGLRGAHQIDNAATAVAILGSVRAALPVSGSAIRNGLAAVRWPGRLDVVAAAPLTIVDGAHNLDGIEAVIRELPTLIGTRPLHLVFAVMADKPWHPMVDALAPRCASVIVTEVRPPRGAPATLVARAFERHTAVRVEPSPRRAWAAVHAEAGSTNAILACGSLFLVGALYADVLAAARARGRSREAMHP